MTELKPSEVLDRAAELIEPEGAWTQKAFARSQPGKEWLGPKWPLVRVCWCMRGALFEVVGASPLTADIADVEAILDRVLPASSVGFNDTPGRTQPEVVAALRKAADLARADGQ